VKRYLASEFKMKDIGLMHYFLGLEVWRYRREIFLGQGKYAVEILRRFRMEDCKPMATPMITNLKKVITSDSELVDPRIYRLYRLRLGRECSRQKRAPQGVASAWDQQ
jgi:hypothetical protein